jgi:hypothetical protein
MSGPGAPTPISRPALHDPNETAFSRFMREEIWSPEKLPGNVNIAVSLTLFFGGIAAIRSWGDLLIPA